MLFCEHGNSSDFSVDDEDDDDDDAANTNVNDDLGKDGEDAGGGVNVGAVDHGDDDDDIEYDDENAAAASVVTTAAANDDANLYFKCYCTIYNVSPYKLRP